MEKIENESNNVPRRFGPSIGERISVRDNGEVFGYRLMGTMDNYLQKAIEIRLNQWVNGVTDGLVRFIEEVAQDAVKTAVKVEIANNETHDVSIMKEETKTNEPEVIETEVNEEKYEVDPGVIVIPKDFALPRNRSGYVNWAGTGQGMHKMMLMYLMRRAEAERNTDLTYGKNFAKTGPDFNGAYQRIKEILGGGWKDALKAYSSTVFEE